MQKHRTRRGELCPFEFFLSKTCKCSHKERYGYRGVFLGGGIQNSFNKESYPAFSGEQPLYTPYRSGFRFLGWYSDAALHKQIKTIPTDRKDHYILYAKWTAKINNYYNVEYYNYHKRESRFGKNLVLLKDLDYSFYNEIDIPGMPDTREEDVLKNIFSVHPSARRGFV